MTYEPTPEELAGVLPLPSGRGKFTAEVAKERANERAKRLLKAQHRAEKILRQRHAEEYAVLRQALLAQINAEAGPLPGDENA